jgi:hypothetical protein
LILLSVAVDLPTEALAYGMVALISLLVVFAELGIAFGAYSLFSLTKGWTWGLVGINLACALFTYFLARATTNIGPGIIPAIVVGVLYPAILRSRFTFFRKIGDKDDPKLDALSIRLGELYASWQERCYRQVDNAIAVLRSAKAQAVAEKYEEDRIVEVLNRLIASKHLVANREKDAQYLKELLRVPDRDKEMRRFRLAMFLVDIAAGQEDQLLQGKSTPP